MNQKQTPKDGAQHDQEQVAPDTASENGAAVDTNVSTDATEIEALRKEVQANLDGWQRTLAEFQNYRRRMERESRERYENGTVDVLKSLLPIMDDFERAMANLPDTAQEQAWLNGVSLIQRKFTKLLEDNNITSLDPVGEPFDPSRHEALGTDDSTDMASGHVTATLQKGYISGDRVLRPALVKVAP